MVPIRECGNIGGSFMGRSVQSVVPIKQYENIGGGFTGRVK